MPLAAGFVGIIPALGLLNPKDDGVPAVQLNWISAISWSLAVAFFGSASQFLGCQNNLRFNLF
jgi:hypothetical protein